MAANYAGDDVVVSLRGWFVMAVLSLSVGAVRDQHIPGPDLHMGEKGWIGIIFYFIFSFFRGYLFLFFFLKCKLFCYHLCLLLHSFVTAVNLSSCM